MSERHTGELEQQLCCLMDDELGASEALFMLKRMENDVQLRQRWERMHLARSVFQDRRAAGVGDLSDRVSSAIADQSPEAAPVTDRMRRWFQPLAGAAVAASVAVVAFNYWQSPGDIGLDSAPALLVDRPTGDLDGTVNNRSSRIAVPVASSAEILQQYMIRHALATGSGNTLPYVHIVIDPVVDSQEETEQATDGDAQTAR